MVQIPVVRMNQANADFGFRIDADTILVWDDPGHRRILESLVRRLPGASLEFRDVSLDEIKQSIRASLAATEMIFNDAQATIARLRAAREAEAEGIKQHLQDLKAERDSGAATQVIPDNVLPENATHARASAFGDTAEGRSLDSRIADLQARLDQVNALMTAADNNTDSTYEQTVAAVALANASARLQELRAITIPPSGSAPTVLGTLANATVEDFDGVKGISEKTAAQIIASAQAHILATPAA